ncbi:MAG: response regulator [Acidobacteria bacterium]|nr:response regulator [Acidobacteriota bacterium]
MGKTVLTIDDSKTVRAVISKHLSPFSVGMLEAENGEEGVECARKGSPDLILLDYNMPVMDGYHTLVELKTDPSLKAIPVVMVTTETSKETVVKLLKLGLNDYIAKPFTREILLRKVNPILKLYSGDEIPPETDKDSRPEGESVAAAEDPGKPSILAVDDKASVLDLLREYLGDQYRLATVDSGKAGLTAMAKKDFDCIFLDLSMPDMSGLDVLDQYLQGSKKEAIEKKVIAMTLRSAHQDIRRASDLGLQIFLYKPFTRADVEKAIEQAMEGREESSAKKLHYLTMKGKTPILDCPAQKSSKYRFYAEFLTTDISQEIDGIVEEGETHLIIRIGEGFLSKIGVSQNFLHLMQHISDLNLSVRLVAESSESREILKQHEETAGVPIDVSLECALGLIES